MPTGLAGKNKNGNPVTKNTPDWPIYFSNFDKAWGLPPNPGFGKSKGEGVIIGHPDTGFTSHPELIKGGRLRSAEGVDYLDTQAAQPRDTLSNFPVESLPFLAFPSHGTKTASAIMSAEGHPNTPTSTYPDYTVPPSRYVTGVAPRSELIPYRVTRSVHLDGNTLPNLARAIYACIKKDVGVISISLGNESTPTNRSTREAIKNATKNGIVVVAAAAQTVKGENLTDPAFPGNDPNTVCAAACDYDHNMLPDGLYGPEVDITAPGIDMWNAFSERDYGVSADVDTGGVDIDWNTFAAPVWNYPYYPIPTITLRPPSMDVRYYKEAYGISSDGKGTSYATAVTAGACALWQAHWGRQWLLSNYDPSMIPRLFKLLLTCSCDTPSNWDTGLYGAGVLDAEALLKIDLNSINKTKLAIICQLDYKLVGKTHLIDEVRAAGGNV